MKIHFNCNSTVYSYCRTKKEHQASTIKRYFHPTYDGNYQLIEICDFHFGRAKELGLHNLILSCQIGCNHIRCQQAYK